MHVRFSLIDYYCNNFSIAITSAYSVSVVIDPSPYDFRRLHSR